MENIVVLATDQHFGVDVEQLLEGRASTASGTDDEQIGS